MAEIISFTQVTDLYNELKRDCNLGKDKPEKFMASLICADTENKKLLDEFTITLRHPSQWIILTQDNEILRKTLLRAKDLGFLDAYQQNPNFLKADVDKVIKRMSELEHLDVAYKNEKGAYLSYLFSERAYNYVVNQVAPKASTEVKEVASEPQNVELKELADRIMETVALTSEAPTVYKKIAELEGQSLGAKEVIMEVFKSYSDNLNYLSSIIDEVLLNNAEEERQMGRVA